MFDYDNNYYNDGEGHGWYGRSNNINRMNYMDRSRSLGRMNGENNMNAMSRMDCMDMNQIDRMDGMDMNGRTQRRIRSRSNSICRVQSARYDY